MKTKGPRRNGVWKYTPEVEERIAALYGNVLDHHIAGMLTREFGMPFTREGIKQHVSRKMGITTADAQGNLSISDAARELGIPGARLNALIKRQGLAVTGSGRCRFLTPETWRAVQAYYMPPPEPTVSLQQAADSLKRGFDWTYNQVMAQRLKAYKHGGDWRVSCSDLERFRWELIRSRK